MHLDPVQILLVLLLFWHFNCEGCRHSSWECPKSLIFSNATAQKFEFFKKNRAENSVYFVLTNTRFQMDGYKPQTQQADNDLKIFLEIVSPHIDQSSDLTEIDRQGPEDVPKKGIDYYRVEIDFTKETNKRIRGRLCWLGGTVVFYLKNASDYVLSVYEIEVWTARVIMKVQQWRDSIRRTCKSQNPIASIGKWFCREYYRGARSWRSFLSWT